MSQLHATGLDRHYWCLDCAAWVANAGVVAHAVANPTHRLVVYETKDAADPVSPPSGGGADILEGQIFI
jgi:hypothetical protein